AGETKSHEIRAGSRRPDAYSEPIAGEADPARGAVGIVANRYPAARASVDHAERPDQAEVARPGRRRRRVARRVVAGPAEDDEGRLRTWDTCAPPGGGV